MGNNSIAVTIFKLINVSSIQLGTIPLTHFSINDEVRLMVLQLNFDALRYRSHVRSEGQQYDPPKVFNIICDDQVNTQIPEITNVADSCVVHIDPTYFDSFEKFSGLIADIGYPDLKLSSEFWLPAQSVLTYREIEVLYHVFHGKSSKQIADELNLSARTVELHRQNCSKKIGVITPRTLSRLFSTKVLETYMWSRASKLPDSDSNPKIA